MTSLVVILSLLPTLIEASLRLHETDGSKMQQLPRFQQTQLSNYTMRVGKTVQFSCTVGNLGPLYKVAWLHSEKGTLAVHPSVITQNDRVSVSHDSRETYNLRIADIQEGDAGKYICQINTGPVMSISGTLNVVVPPDILDDESSSDTLAKEGMHIMLNCRARGNPAPTISWVRVDGKPIRICSRRDLIIETQSNSDPLRNNVAKRKHHRKKECREVKTHYGADLELSHVSRFDSGVYLCLANNGIPPTVSKRVRLYVDFPPNIWVPHQRVGSDLGSFAELECLSAAHPASINFWSRDRDGESYVVSKAGKYELTQISGKPSFYNVQMKIRISNVSEDDFGLWRCLAKNSQGETSGEIKLYENPRSATTTITPPISHFDPQHEMPLDFFNANETTSFRYDTEYDVGIGDVFGGGKRHKKKNHHKKRKKSKDHWRNDFRRRDGDDEQRYHQRSTSSSGSTVSWQGSLGKFWTAKTGNIILFFTSLIMRMSYLKEC